MNISSQPFQYSATEAARYIRDGELTSEQLVRSCLDRIGQRDPVIHAWTWVDNAEAIRRAQDLDKHLARFGPKGPLHGVPVGIKDVINTKDFPTQFNSAIYQRFRSSDDADCVAILEAAGALVLGKTETEEFAGGGRKALTVNPHDFRRTPGGSSSGSAAAVCDRHVPITLGTQTGGSMIRPAAFTGIFGFKPTYGIVPWSGVRNFAHSMDTLGWYARTVDDLALLADVFSIPGKEDFDLQKTGRIALIETRHWAEVSDEYKEAIGNFVEVLRAAEVPIGILELPSSFDTLRDAQEYIMNVEGGVNMLHDFATNRDALDSDFISLVETWKGVSRETLRQAFDTAARCRAEFDKLLSSNHIDAVMTPSATGIAPLGLQTSGSPAMNAIWTLLHVPCVALPIGQSSAGLPLGLQVSTRRYDDYTALKVAGELSSFAPSLKVPE